MVTDLLRQLQQDQLIDAEIKTKLAQKFSGLKLSLVSNEVCNAGRTSNRRYSDDVMQFAHTLHFLSPKAYRFVRKTMYLPCESTLRSRQSVRGEPGWTAETFDALKQDAEKTDCVLIMDAMHLKSAVQWSPALKRFVGYEDFGNGACEEGDMAREACRRTRTCVACSTGILFYCQAANSRAADASCHGSSCSRSCCMWMSERDVLSLTEQLHRGNRGAIGC